MASTNRLQHIIYCLTEYKRYWLLPAIGGLVLAMGYAFFLKGESWTARQSMIIRDDLLGENFKPGSFPTQEAMQSAMETVLETARRPEVIRATLEKLGPSRKSLFGLGGVPSGWPSDKTVEEMRGAISFESANGGEIGKSEVIVLAAKASSQDRSVKLLSILTEEIDRKLSEIRADRFESMEAELMATCESARKSRNELESRLAKMIGRMGKDIGIVKSIYEPSTGSPSAFDNKLNQIHAEQRKAMRDLAAARAFKRTMERAQNSPEIDLPTSAEMLASQPSLAALVQNLAKAKQTLAEAEGNYTPEHGRVKNGRNQVESIKQQIKEAIGPAIRGIDSQIAMFQEQVDAANRRLDQNFDKLQQFGSESSDYLALKEERKKRTEDFTEATTKLAQVRSRKNASGSIRLLTKIGDPWVGTRADGMGKRAMTLIGGIGGLFIGFGLVMIVAPPFVDPEQERLEQFFQDSASSRDQYLEPRRQPVPSDLPDTHPEPAVDRYEPEPEPVPEIEPAVAASSAPTVETQASVDEEPPENSGDEISYSPAAETESAPPTSDPLLDSVTSESSSMPGSFQASGDAVLEIGNEPLNIRPRSYVDLYDDPTLDEGSSSVEATASQLEDPTTEPVQRVSALTEPVESQIGSGDTVGTEVTTDTSVAMDQPDESAQSSTSSMASKPVSKTLAAIFANMPQPRTDATVVPSVPSNAETGVDESAQNIVNKIESLANELQESTESGSESEAAEASERQPTETIQLDSNQFGTDGALPLQRRTSVRPIDLARIDDSLHSSQDQDHDEGNSRGTSQEMIDNAFSDLKPRAKADSNISD